MFIMEMEQRNIKDLIVDINVVIGDKNNLTNTPVCSTICDNYGCK